MVRMLWKVALPATGWTKTYRSMHECYRFALGPLADKFRSDPMMDRKVEILQSNVLDDEGQRVWKVFHSFDMSL